MVTPIIRVVVTGPESTGKTTLARELAKWAGADCVPETSRLYAERIGRGLEASDVAPIAREHIASADGSAARAAARDARLLVLDTDLVSTVVYARHYYQAVPPWIERAERARRADLYLLCEVDVPWVPDGVRDRPADRGAMFELFRRALVRRGAHLVVVRGHWTARREIARAALSTALAVGS